MLAAGTIVDKKYKIVSVLGMGGFGAVYKAEQLGMQRMVALKMLQHVGLPNDIDRKRFELEARLLSSIKHRNLVLFYGYGVWEGCPYMAMEFVDGTPLQSHLSAVSELPPAETLALCKQILQALGSIHSNGFVHRDLKPPNILLTRDTAISGGASEVKLIDFGLAKVLQAAGVTSQKLTETGFVVGTVEYIAPEQCLGHTCDGRSDIYSLGCVMFRCLTGRQPFVGDDTFAVLQQHLHDMPPQMSALRPELDLPNALQAIVEKAMAKDPAERFQDTEQMLSAIEAFENGRALQLTAGKKKPVKMPKHLKRLAIVAAVGAFSLPLAYLAVSKVNPSQQVVHPTSVEAFYQSDRYFRDAVTHFNGWSSVIGNPVEGKTADAVFTGVVTANNRDHLLDDDKQKLGLIYGRLAEIKLGHGEWQAARDCAEKAVYKTLEARSFSTDIENFVFAYDDACVHLHDPAGAEAMQRKVIADWQRSCRNAPTELVQDLSNNLVKQKRYDEAISLMEDFISQYPDGRSDKFREQIAELKTKMAKAH